MLKIRLQRVGRKHEPAFRLVLTDSENSTKSGRFAEILGSYDPRKSTDQIDGDRVKYWLSQGAQATGSVHNLLVNHKVIDAKKVNVLPKKVVAKAPAVSDEASAKAEPEAAPVAEAAPAEVPAEPAEAPIETAPEEVAPASEPEAPIAEEAAPAAEETPAE